MYSTYEYLKDFETPWDSYLQNDSLKHLTNEDLYHIQNIQHLDPWGHMKLPVYKEKTNTTDEPHDQIMDAAEST